MTYNYSNMSMLEVAEQLMQRKKTPQSFRKIAQEVSELMGMSEEELRQKITRFYADLTLSGKFVNVSGDKWDLKTRQKFEVYENQFVYEDDEDDLADIDDEEMEDEEEEEDFDDDDIDDDYEEDYDDDEDDLT
ncbi:MAG TPA: DNA-directed RNA polymerase subunit delta [Haloplasmataceae bacterium]